ncbi:MAG: helicase HerA-like domain-containing protein [Rhodospirillales bacterium]
MTANGRILIGKAKDAVYLDLRFANRHGLIAGATGTGKTVTLQRLAEGFSAAGVPVFLADVKGDLSGLCVPGTGSGKLAARAQEIGLTDYAPASFPCLFWDVLQAEGHPVRATVSEIGPLLLGRLLELNDTQEGVLNAAFAVADHEGLLLLDLKDLRAILSYVADNAAALRNTYGNISATSIGAIQRGLLVLEREGGERFFGEPALRLADMMRTDRRGYGYVSILCASELIQKPRLYAVFLLWLMSELFEELPEVGDPEKPKLVLFFDEAHLLFDGAPKSLVDKVEQVVRLIRSKGVGVYFITQSPADVPDDILAQLGNRVQHALRAFTPKDQKAVKAAAETFRANPALDTARAILELGVGEALVSTLEAGGVPAMVERTLIAPPVSRVGPATAEERAVVINASPVAGAYDRTIDRESAYEMLAERAAAAPSAAAADRPAAGRGRPRAPAASTTEQIVASVAKSAARSMGTTVGRQLVRGLLGSLFRSR